MALGRRPVLVVSGCISLVGMVGAVALAAPPPGFEPQSFANPFGVARSLSLRGAIDANNPFFQSLGSNGRACVHCHQPNEGWGITPAGLKRRFDATEGTDPVFRTNDGSNSPLADVSTVAARRQSYSMLLNRGLIRVGLPIPDNAEFELAEVDDPYGFASASELSLFRRPLPSTNLRFLSAVMWDGRQSPAGRTFKEHYREQARSAVLGHAEGVMPSNETLDKIVDFELALFTAQVQDSVAGNLIGRGALGGPDALALQGFHMGINDPIAPDPAGATSSSEAFHLFNKQFEAAITPTARKARQAAIRGQAIFNTRQFDVSGVSGLNDVLGVPTIKATCTTCHNTPNSGNHSMPRPLNIGLTDAIRRTPDMPLYTLRNKDTGATTQTTDPGRALITGKWSDIGRFKGPVLRGLAARAPYFHNGLAKNLGEVVDFYNTRFDAGFTRREKEDLIAFMRLL